jgi:predicted MPP superfamily phosphohydrolase
MKDMRWLFLLGVWVLAEGVGYWGLRQLGLWRRWMGWITPLTLGLFLLLWAITAFLAKGVAAKLLLSEMGGLLFFLWLMLILVKLVVGGWGVLVGVVSRLHRRLKGVSRPPAAESAPAVETLLSRRQFLVGVGEALALAPVGVMGYAFLKGRYRFQVEEVELRFPHLPIAFDGLRLLQISDLHSGSFYFGPARLEPAWELIQKARADVLCFTGDWVNVYAEELEPFVGVLSELSAPLGKWATLGNHDYGDYARWNSPAEKNQNHHHLLRLIEQAGFTLLQDTAISFGVGEEALYLVGTGNWGYWNRRQRYGDIGKAWRDVPENAFTILLTHDPTHWEYQVSGKYPAELTLSGHTHGLQMGIPVNGRYWSPASWLYRYWAGLYEGPPGRTDGHTFPTYLYVNRGLGYIGLPARFGVWPEITLIRLRRG